jgi:hypothetical protein
VSWGEKRTKTEPKSGKTTLKKLSETKAKRRSPNDAGTAIGRQLGRLAKPLAARVAFQA